MTVDEAIDRADRLRPNRLRREEKAEWVLELERRLRGEIGLPPPRMSCPACAGEELIAADGYEEIYPLWLCGRIDFALGAMDGWNADAALFNEAAASFKKQYLRDNEPPFERARNVWRREK